MTSTAKKLSKADTFANLEIITEKLNEKILQFEKNKSILTNDKVLQQDKTGNLISESIDETKGSLIIDDIQINRIQSVSQKGQINKTKR